MAVGVWAYIEDGMCRNVIVFDPDDCGTYPRGGLVYLCPDPPPPGSPGIGWGFDGTAWTEPVPEPPEPDVT